jgi:hypothetical protein
MINHCDRPISLLSDTDCISITKKSDRSITDLSCYDSDYCISITKKTDRSITVIITLLGDTDTVVRDIA